LAGARASNLSRKVCEVPVSTVTTADTERPRFAVDLEDQFSLDHLESLGAVRPGRGIRREDAQPHAYSTSVSAGRTSPRNVVFEDEFEMSGKRVRPKVTVSE
jgi:hypothetical protein